MQNIRSFRDIIAWQKAMEVVEDTYAVTAQLPDCERFGLMSQMRRCAVSMPSNIAEGHGRGTTADFVRFLQVSRGSTYELSTQAEVCARLGHAGDFRSVLDGTEEVGRILNGLITSLESKLH